MAKTPSEIENIAVEVALEEVSKAQADALKRVQDILSTAKDAQDATVRIAAQFKEEGDRVRAEAKEQISVSTAARAKAEQEALRLKNELDNAASAAANERFVRSRAEGELAAKSDALAKSNAALVAALARPVVQEPQPTEQVMPEFELTLNRDGADMIRSVTARQTH